MARGIKSIRVRPQVGQAISFTPRRKPRALRMSFPARISSAGSAARDTRMVSPMPCCKRLPMPMADFTSPIRAVPAWVMPRCRGYPQRWAAIWYAWMVKSTEEAFMDRTISVKSNLSSREAWYRALSARAWGVGWPYLARICFSSEPSLTPTRMGIPRWRQASATALTRLSPPMLPGLMRILSIPAAADSRASL